MTTITAKGVMWIILKEVVRLHRIAESIVPSRDTQFTSIFWKELQKLMGTKLLMSTTFHPQTDGATEWANRLIPQITITIYNQRKLSGLWVFLVIRLVFESKHIWSSPPDPQQVPSQCYASTSLHAVVCFRQVLCCSYLAASSASHSHLCCAFAFTFAFTPPCWYLPYEHIYIPRLPGWPSRCLGARNRLFQHRCVSTHQSQM